VTISVEWFLTHGHNKGSMPFSSGDVQEKAGGKDFDR
jgi:hypothetical protein